MEGINHSENGPFLHRQILEWCGADESIAGPNKAIYNPTPALRPFIDEYRRDGGIGAIELRVDVSAVIASGRLTHGFLILYPVKKMTQVTAIKYCLNNEFRRRNHLRVFIDEDEMEAITMALADETKRPYIKFSVTDHPERIPNYELPPNSRYEYSDYAWHCIYLILSAFGGGWNGRSYYLDHLYANMKFILQNNLVPDNLISKQEFN